MRDQVIKYRYILRKDNHDLMNWLIDDFGDSLNCPICTAKLSCSYCAAVVNNTLCMYQDWFKELSRYNRYSDPQRVRTIVRSRLRYWVNLYSKTYKSKI